MHQVVFTAGAPQQQAGVAGFYFRAASFQLSAVSRLLMAESLLEGARMIGVTGMERAATGHRYVIAGNVSETDVQRIAEELLANEVIQTYVINWPVSPPFVPVQTADDTVEIIPLTEADDAALEAISRERRLSLDLAEMRAIRAYYRQESREPTDVELEMLAQTWSEHSESLGRFVVAVAPEDVPAFEACLAGLPVARVGQVRGDDRVRLAGLDSQPVIDTALDSLERAWRGHLNVMRET